MVTCIINEREKMEKKEKKRWHAGTTAAGLGGIGAVLRPLGQLYYK